MDQARLSPGLGGSYKQLVRSGRVPRHKSAEGPNFFGGVRETQKEFPLRWILGFHVDQGS